MIATAPEHAFDVAVVGAGPAGSATARWLALRGARVALVERSAFDVPRIGESLAPAVQPLLRQLGVWSEFLALGPIQSFGTCSHWGGEEPQVHSHLMNPWGSGWHVDRLAFDRMLAYEACRAGAVPMFGRALTACEAAPVGWRLTLTTRDAEDATPRRSTVSARLLIDATGRPARCAAFVGARRASLDRLVGAAVRCAGASVDAEPYVLVETTADGWWYTAPIPGGGMIAMLLTDGDICRRLSLTSPSSWWYRARRATATAARLSRVRPATTGTPRVFPAASHRLVRAEKHRPWLSVGDAALAVDPISGSGVVRALKTARAAAEAGCDLLDTGEAEVIERYETDRNLEFTRYLEERAGYYGIERRWLDDPFWARRALREVAVE